VVVAIGLVELVVVVLALAEAVHNVAQQQVELRHFGRVSLIEVSQHLVGHFVLGLRAARATTIAGGMKDDLCVRLNLPDRRLVARPEDLLQCEPGFRRRARAREWQRLDLVQPIELIDGLVCGSVGRVLDHKGRRVGGRLRLREHRRVQGPGATGSGSAGRRRVGGFGHGLSSPWCDRRRGARRLIIGAGFRLLP